jgi:alkanesulfonate monooxygenase SsuD/methylene tetrahydromethanopterin reductase-like flavin-dependent oxidoreductase (luciferase family)
VRVDLAINPFGADVRHMVDVAVLAESLGADAVWLTDHFSGSVVSKPWSRDPFVCLGAMAVATSRIGLGILVANVVNRHPAQLASAVNSLQSLAPGRVLLGVGSGAAQGSRFAVEHDAIGTVLAEADERRRVLVDSIGALRAIWSGARSFEAPGVGFDGLDGVVDGSPCPPIIVGASAWATIAAAVEVADGVNIRATERTDELLRRLAEVRPASFEVSVLDWLHADDLDIDGLGAAGCDRLILGVSAPFDHAAIASRFAGLDERS